MLMGTAAKGGAAMRSLKNSHAPGICSITVELCKTGGECLTQWPTHIINHVWVDEEVLDDWRHGVILPFWKHKGAKLICSDQ